METMVLHHPELDGATERFLIDDSWIEWAGGACPLQLGQRFDIRYRDGIENSRPRIVEGPWLLDAVWGHVGVVGDIIAYRVRG
jgi:hypothetical protein